MSVQFVCDGCAKPVAEPKEVGHVTKRQYCAECAVKADLFIDAEEALRKTLHERFTADRDLLIAKFTDGGFRLPDIGGE